MRARNMSQPTPQLVCSATMGKTWGLKTRVLQWIYTMVIRPILTYGSIVWWPRVRYISRTAQQTTEISLPGHNWGDENNPNSSNGGPSGTTIFIYDKCGGS
jgi:hypothetical protein